VSFRDAGLMSPRLTGGDAFGYDHERKDEERSIGLGPEHDCRAIRRMHSDIWQSLTRSRQSNRRPLDDRRRRAWALIGQFDLQDAAGD
jgi:hypothetical protein